MRDLKTKLRVARGELPADLLLQNAQLVNVLSGEIHPAHIAIADGRTVARDVYAATEVIARRELPIEGGTRGQNHSELTQHIINVICNVFAR